jgi:hypothetical protein
VALSHAIVEDLSPVEQERSNRQVEVLETIDAAHQGTSGYKSVIHPRLFLHLPLDYWQNESNSTCLPFDSLSVVRGMR